MRACVICERQVEVMNTTAAPVATQDVSDHEHPSNAEAIASVALTFAMFVFIYQCWKWLKRCCATRREQIQSHNASTTHINQIQSHNATTPRNEQIQSHNATQTSLFTHGFPVVAGIPVVAGVPVGVPNSNVVPYAEKPAIRPELRFVSSNDYNNKIGQEAIEQTINDIKEQLQNLQYTNTDSYWQMNFSQFKNFVEQYVQKKFQYLEYYDQAINDIFTKIAGITDTSRQSILTPQAYYDWLNS